MAGLTPVVFDVGRPAHDMERRESLLAKGYVSSSIRLLQEQLQYQPGFVPNSEKAYETGSNGSLSPPPSPGTAPTPTPRPPQLDVRKKQLAIQLGSEFAKRQEASVKAHLSAWRARPLKEDAYNFKEQVGEITHVSQHVNSASAWLRETNTTEKITAALPKMIIAILATKGWKEVVEEKWCEVTEDEVEELLEHIRSVVSLDAWDSTRVLGLGQREVLGNSFNKIVQADCSNIKASPSNTCKCLLALCKANITTLQTVGSVIEKQSIVYANMMRSAKDTLLVPPPSPSCRTAPYPMKGDLRGELAGLQRKPGKVGLVRRKQLEVLLEDAQKRQSAEVMYHKKIEGTRPLQEFHKSNGIKLGMTPLHVPCVASPTCFLMDTLNSDVSMCSMSVDEGDEPRDVGMDGEAESSHASQPPANVGTPCLASLMLSLKLTQYTFDLKKAGYDLPTDLQGISKNELLSIGFLPGHAQRLLNAVSSLPPQPPLPISMPMAWSDSPTLRSLIDS
eukprot:TRINITY_DN14417_c0_g1_i1.p1 TRINITY_DN14417_c0_g1~~TRINITY_DN14417_c0_g1_i1.p1  ORF type:complete len:505 (+),score=123.23 TRINITY_DN14417_c0_g1_i1:31-1545(+)